MERPADPLPLLGGREQQFADEMAATVRAVERGLARHQKEQKRFEATFAADMRREVAKQLKRIEMEKLARLVATEIKRRDASKRPVTYAKATCACAAPRKTPTNRTCRNAAECSSMFGGRNVSKRGAR